ncbi:hypothetical protein [Natronococcus wangiae]|uniref:hypothetical protein n=1 Tax=Natronococcus wangiae TaxID=3068275 RepID=UPI00273D40BA|nr:hypothetical protein [Natronococcus sp. AD5]
MGLIERLALEGDADAERRRANALALEALGGLAGAGLLGSGVVSPTDPWPRAETQL